MKITRRTMLGIGAGVTASAAAFPQIFVPNTKVTKPRKIIFYTDLHTRTEWDTPRALELAANAINQRKPDLIFGGGDYITDGFQNTSEKVAPRWDAYFNFHRNLKAPVFNVIGNHDLVAAKPANGIPAANPRSEFLNRFGVSQTYQMVDTLGYRFILLDSIDETTPHQPYRGYVSQEQIAWMKKVLADTPKDKPILLLTHLPLMTTFYQATQQATEPAPDSRVVVNNREVLACFEGRNLVAVLQGHLHVYEKILWQQTQFIMGGAICAKWWRGNWHGTEEGFCEITLQKNQVHAQYIEYPWDAKRP